MKPNFNNCSEIKGLRFFTKEISPYYCCFLHTKKDSGGARIHMINKSFPLKPSLIFTSNFKDWWVMMKKTQAQWIPCLYQWWKTMGTLDHKPTKIMWTKEVILRHRNVWNQENLVRILNFTQPFTDSRKIILNLELSFPS